MRDAESIKQQMEETEDKILSAAYDAFIKYKIEGIDNTELARLAGVGRATLFRHYPTRTELAYAVSSKVWKEYLDDLDRVRPFEALEEITAIDRLSYTLDSYIAMYRERKDLLNFYDNFNHFISREEMDDEKKQQYLRAIHSADRRFHLMYERAKEDHTFRTDMSEEAFVRITSHTMLAACQHYAGGLVWGAVNNQDYTEDLLRVKNMILQYMTGDIS